MSNMRATYVTIFNLSGVEAAIQGRFSGRVMIEKLISDIEDARNEFDYKVENGHWCEKWDSGSAYEFLARHLIGQGWSKNA